MKLKLTCVLVFLAMLIGLERISMASSGYLAAFKASYPASAARLESCALCHTSPPALNSYGSDFAAHHPSGSTPDQAFAAIEALDSDGDGYTNVEELTAGSMPGDIAERPDTLATASPQGSGTTITGTSNPIYNAGQTPPGSTPTQIGSPVSSSPTDNAAVCANCHTDGRSGTPPSGHQDISAYLPSPTGNPGGSTLANNAAVCLTCHSDGRSGATPPGHPDISQLTQILFDASGGSTPTSNAAICARCHDGRSGTIPGDHPNLTGSLNRSDDEEEGDD